MPQGHGSARLQNIDALRGIAAFLVMWQHVLTSDVVLRVSSDASALILGLCVGWFDIGKFGVLAFFAISGYVIPFSFKGDDPIRRFAISRFFRLYPAYWVSIIAYALVLVGQGSDLPAKVILINLTMLQRVLGAPDFIGVYWTLFIELIFYVLCAVAVWFGIMKDARAVIGAIAGFSALLVVTALAIFLTGKHLPVAPLFGLNVMFLGTLYRLAQIEGDRLAAAALPAVTLLCCLSQVIGCYLSYIHNTEAGVTPWYGQSLATVVALTVFVLASRYSGTVPKPLIFLGAISYALYLMHEVVIAAFRYSFSPTPVSAAGFMLVVLVAVILVSWLVHRFVEQPSIAIGKRVANRRVGRGLEA